MKDSDTSQQERALALATQNVPATTRDFLSAVVNLSEAGIYHEPTCELCSHEMRSQAETYYESMDKLDRNKATKLQTWLNIERSLDLPIDVIRNHVENHMNRGDIERRKIEYVNKINNLSAIDVSSLDRIKFGMAAITERIQAINSCTAPQSKVSSLALEEKKSKVTNDLVKTYLQLVNIQSDLLGELMSRGDVFKIQREKFGQAFDNALSNAENDAERIIIASLMDDLVSAQIDPEDD